MWNVILILSIGFPYWFLDYKIFYNQEKKWKRKKEFKLIIKDLTSDKVEIH